MRLALVAGSVVLTIVGCGSDDAVTPVTQQVNETPITTFACGGTTCSVNEHACCPVGSTFGCFLLAEGCPGGGTSDGGADGGGGLKCTSYRNCTTGGLPGPGGGAQCCYDSTTGASACAMTCPPGNERLCIRGQDACRADEDCEELQPAPLGGVGHCVRD